MNSYSRRMPVAKMVNGNYIVYGDEPPLEHLEPEQRLENNNIHCHTPERKIKRKPNRTANELQYTLNMAQIDNDTDSIKHERKVKEPRLLRYVATTDVEENFVNDKFETYDMKPAEEPPRRYTFAKKPKNPADGSINYAYSRSSSNCSSPNGNLPTISEHGEQYGTFRVRAPPSPSSDMMGSYDNKLDKYFSKPREVKKFTAKGSHPDSLYRVPAGGDGRDEKILRALRLLRWPAALLTVCVALAVFVYFLMPDTNADTPDAMNSTFWSRAADVHRSSTTERSLPQYSATPTPIGTKTPEIDFYDADADVNNNNLPPLLEVITDKNGNRKLPVPPVFPSHIVPEVQYGNEKADSDKGRSPKLLSGQPDKQPEDSTLKPHITQKPEKPLAIYFKDGAGITTSTETIVNAESANDFSEHHGKAGKSKEYKDKRNNGYIVRKDNLKQNVENINDSSLEFVEIEDSASRDHVDTDGRFTSGHSKLFGISIEDAAKFRSTTQSSLYNTRVSPTLPVWRDIDDTTTNKYPVNANIEVGDVQPQCRSTHLTMCRGVLPYDLTSGSIAPDGSDLMPLLPHFEYLVGTNCSDRVRQFACTLLEPECSPPPLSPRAPCFDLCKAVMDGCDGQAPTELLSLVQCQQYPRINCVKARSPCFDRELRCGDGSCVPRDWICDGRNDCPGGEDEASCILCSQEEHRCPTGECILKRWLCDGYADCPNGEDELDSNCSVAITGKTENGGELGEESAASVPAASIRRPNRLPAPQHLRRSEHSRADYDNSRELLVTSDTSNPYRRNYTRRPAASRLTPYSRPILHDSRYSRPSVGTKTSPAEPGKTKTQDDMKTLPSIQKERKASLVKTDNVKTPEAPVKQESSEDVNLGDLSFFNEFEKGMKNEDSISKISEASRVQASKRMGKHGRAPPPPSGAEIRTEPSTRLDKSIDNFERVFNGAELIRKKEAANAAADVGFSEEDNSPETHRGRGVMKVKGNKDYGHRNESLMSAHASPCPSGELRCVDGRCITLSQLCDGTIDCTDHADEDNCYT